MQRRYVLIASLVAAVFAVFVATSGAHVGSPNTAAAAANGATATAAAAAPASVVSTLPKSIQPSYKGFDGFEGASVWGKFKAKSKPPWTIGYASSYAGNTWRAGSLNEFEKVLVPEYKKAGLLKNFIVEQSNLNDTTQIQQAHELISKGANILLFCCTDTAMVPVINYAGQHGVPVVTFSGHTDSKYSVNIYSNYKQSGIDMANFIAKQMGDKGNLLYVNGIPGQASNNSVDSGVYAALKKHPNIKLVGTVNGEWTDQIAKTKVLQFLSTHPGTINGVITQSAQEVGVLQAFLQSGRPLPPMTQGGEKGAACYWLKHPSWKTKIFTIWPPADEADGAMSVMMRILEGQGPKIESITRDPAEVGLSQVKTQLSASSCNTSDSSWFEPNPWFSQSYLNHFFKHPANPLSFKS